MKTVFEKGRHSAGKKSLEWARVRNGSPQGFVFVPPLIGGNVSQQVIAFRWLVRQGYDLFSFNYSGHGGSSGKFSLGASIGDTLHMLDHALHLGRKEGLPFFGIASCYSAIPLLHATHRLEEPMKKLVLINAIPRLGPKAVITSFFSHYVKSLPVEGGFLGFSAAVGLYADSLFPGVVKGKDFFGVLERSRARLLKMISEFFTLNPLEGVRLATTPVLCIHARKDSILEIYGGSAKTTYQDDIRRVCPKACFKPVDGDHFLSPTPAKGEAMKSIASFFRQNIRMRSPAGPG